MAYRRRYRRSFRSFGRRRFGRYSFRRRGYPMRRRSTRRRFYVSGMRF